jgi:hypothetical protein
MAEDRSGREEEQLCARNPSAVTPHSTLRRRAGRALRTLGLARWYEANLGVSVFPATDEWWTQ